MTMPNGTRGEEKERAEARRKRQERKKAQQKAMKTGVWDKCLYRVPGRERYCAQSRSVGVYSVCRRVNACVWLRVYSQGPFCPYSFHGEV